MNNIRITNLSKIYIQGESQITALKDINVEFNNGDFVAIIGKSGSGKSTLLHMIAGLDNATTGNVFINEIDITKLKENELCAFRLKNTGIIFQAYYLIPELSAIENITYPVLLNGQKPDMDYINEIISVLNIQDRINHLPYQLSGGEQQRVSIARALSNKPQLMLCDEPTGNLDEESGLQVIEMLKNIQQRLKQTILLVTHDMEIAKNALKTIKIVNGKINE